MPLEKKVSLHHLKEMKKQQAKFASIALYDANTAALAQQSGVEVVLVGDSLGMTVLGYDSTVPVTMEHMLHHIGAVARGNQKSFIIGDLPFMAYATEECAMLNASRVMQAGAHMVKVEGGRWLADTTAKLNERGIPVCAHLGLTPQSIHKLGGFRVQGKSDKERQVLIEDALILQEAGADLIVLECVPKTLASEITATLTIPTIGIGAGPDTDAQVLVINDLLGLTAKPPKFAKNFLLDAPSIAGALEKYVADVKDSRFPQAENYF